MSGRDDYPERLAALHKALEGLFDTAPIGAAAAAYYRNRAVMAYLKGCGWRLRRVMFASKVSRFWSRLARLPGVFAWAGRLAFYRSITQLSRLIGGILGR